MGKSGKIFIGALAVSALVGTAYASWTVMGGYYSTTTGVEDPTIATIETKNIAIEVTKKDANEKLVFDEPGKEHLSLTYTVKAKQGEDARDDFNPYDVSQYAGLAVDYQPHLSIETKVTGANENFAKYVTVPSVEIHYNDWLGKGNATDGYDVTLTFAWGEATNGENPQTYVNEQYAAGNESLKTPELQKAFFEEVNKALTGAKFEFTFKVGGLKTAPGTDTPVTPEPEPEPEPETPDLWTIYFQDKGWWNTSGANTNIVLYDAAWNMLDADYNTIDSSTNWNVGIDMTYESNPGYYNGVNFFSYTIDLNKVANVQFVRRGGEVEAYWDANTKTVAISSAKEWNLVTLSDTPAWNNEGGGWASAEVTTSLINFDDYKRAEASVTINAMTNGSVSANKTEGLAGDEITLTIAPDTNYELDTLTWNGADIKGSVADNKATVTLAAGVNTVSATFKEVSGGGEEPVDPPVTENTVTILAQSGTGSKTRFEGAGIMMYFDPTEIGMTAENQSTYSIVTDSVVLDVKDANGGTVTGMTLGGVYQFEQYDYTNNSVCAYITANRAPEATWKTTISFKITNGTTTWSASASFTGSTYDGGTETPDEPVEKTEKGALTVVEDGTTRNTCIHGAGVWVYIDPTTVGMDATNYQSYSITNIKATIAGTEVTATSNGVIDLNFGTNRVCLNINLASAPGDSDKTTVEFRLESADSYWTCSTSFTGTTWDGATTTPVEEYTTVAEALAATDSTALTDVIGVVAATNSRGFALASGSDYIYVYGGSNYSGGHNVGDVVKVAGTRSTFGGAAQIGSPTVEAYTGTVSESYNFGEAQEFNATNFTSETLASERGYYKFTAKCTSTGNYTNFSFEDDSKLLSLSYYNLGTDLVVGQMYEITGVRIGTSSNDYYVNFMAMSATLVTVAPQSITISATATDIRVGGTTTLSAELAPFGATGSVTYEITEGSDYASIEGNVLTANAAGTVKVVGKVNELTSDAIEITISAASEDEVVSTATITSDILTHSSGYGDGSDIDVNGLRISYFQFMKGTGGNANTLQNRVNSAGDSSIYNTVAIKRIVSVTLNFNGTPATDRTFGLFLGNTAVLSDPQTGTASYTLNVNDNTVTVEGDYTYFRLQRTGDGAAYLTSIVIEYVAA